MADPLSRHAFMAASLAVILSISILAMMLTWLVHYNGGFSLTGRLSFNYHPLLMTVAWAVFSVQAVLAYRMTSDHRLGKGYHSVMHALTLMCVVLALWAVVRYHSLFHYRHFYSLHSWCGLLTVALFAVNGMIGVVAFLLPGNVGDDRRSAMVPVHAAIGRSLTVLPSITMMLGLLEKMTFKLSIDDFLWGEFVLTNVMGLSLILLIFALNTVLSARSQLVVTPTPRRDTRASENSALLHTIEEDDVDSIEMIDDKPGDENRNDNDKFAVTMHPYQSGPLHSTSGTSDHPVRAGSTDDTRHPHHAVLHRVVDHAHIAMHRVKTKIKEHAVGHGRSVQAATSQVAVAPPTEDLTLQAANGSLSVDAVRPLVSDETSVRVKPAKSKRAGATTTTSSNGSRRSSNASSVDDLSETSESMWPAFRGIGTDGVILSSPEA